MKSFFVLSAAGHCALLFALIVLGTLLSKPRMSYYTVDLFSAPAGGGSVSEPAVSPVSSPAPVTPKALKSLKVKAVASAPRAQEEELPDQDTIRMLSKLKKKRLGLIKSQPASAREDSESSESAPERESPASQSLGRGGTGLAGAGSGIMAEAAGPAFPYPWYLKVIANKLDKQWKAPQDFDSDLLCQVTFVINRSGQILSPQISKASGDSVFDQVALRAVVYSNPLPPLPNGYPEETLKVHMKFVGRNGRI